MKKSLITLTIMLAAAAMIAAFSCPALAAVGGQCSNCHTMHYSQGGVSTMYEPDGPFAALLTGSCIGCHTGTNDPLDDTYNTPYVISSSNGFTDTNCLAGGFFPATMGTGNNNDQHHGVVAGQTSVPAGYDSAGDFTYTGTANGLGCAGTNGCHGNEYELSDMDAIKGGHHNTAQTYRMLYINYPSALSKTPVCGDPAPDYEEVIIKTPSTTVDLDGDDQNVNIYSAGSGTSDATISELCGKCHGVFHGENTGSDTDGTKNTDGEWIRHPSDEELPTEWSMGGTYTFNGDDAKNNPFGYTNAIVSGNNTQATCLSCHRAHGTATADLLRWGYDTQIAGGGNAYGCLGCHNKQR